VRAPAGDALPDDCHLYVVGGGEDAAQATAARLLAVDEALERAVDRGAAVLAVCAGVQLLGREFTGSDGARHAGLGLLDVNSSPLVRRAVGEVVADPVLAELEQPLTGFENHGCGTVLGPRVQPLAQVRRGVGNGDEAGTEGVVQGRIVGTYLHGPVLARNPELADLLLSWVVPGPLAPLRLPVVEQLRARQLGSAG
jgi:CobQ-like glutamine amidotransferase family enzyme